MDGLNKSMFQIGSDTAFAILSRSNQLSQQGKDVIILGIGQPDFKTPENIVEAGIRALRDGHHGYSSSNGILELREAVSEYYFKKNIKIDPCQVLITPGAKAVIFYTLLMFGQPESEIIVPNPGFIAYKSMVDYTGAKVISLPHKMQKKFSFDAEELLSLITPKTRLIIFNSPGNPTGGVVPEHEFQKLVKGLENFPNLFILSDEIYERIIFKNQKHISLMSYPEIRDQVILLNGWSKTYSMTGWRLGYGIYPKKLFPFAEKLAINCHSCVSNISQYAGIEALKGPQTFVNKMVKKFEERKNFLVRELNKIKNVECVDPGGAFYVFPKITKNGLSSKQISDDLLEKQFLATVPGSSFGELGEGFIRISYANKIFNLKKSVQLIREYLDE